MPGEFEEQRGGQCGWSREREVGDELRFTVLGHNTNLAFHVGEVGITRRFGTKKMTRFYVLTE